MERELAAVLPRLALSLWFGHRLYAASSKGATHERVTARRVGLGWEVGRASTATKLLRPRRAPDGQRSSRPRRTLNRIAGKGGWRSGEAKARPRPPRRAACGNGSRWTTRSFIGETGHRCEARAFLQFHHERAWELGGPDTVENLRVMCRAHNRLLADRELGAEHVARAIKLAATRD